MPIGQPRRALWFGLTTAIEVDIEIDLAVSGDDVPAQDLSDAVSLATAKWPAGLLPAIAATPTPTTSTSGA
jgi:hypothetical protein